MKIIISIDVDSRYQNRPPFTNNSLDFGFGEEIDKLLTKFDKPMTFFVREDFETIHKLGKNFVFNFIDQFKSKVEIGWHPHFNKSENKPIKDMNSILFKLRQLYDQNDRIKECKIVRIGSCQSSNEIMQFLSQYFTIDSSAIGGCKRQDNFRWYDWSQTHGNFYYPCENNYQLPCNEISLDIVEIPITTTLVKTSYDKSSKKRILNATYKQDIFEKAIKDNFSYLKSLDAIIIACHMEELENLGYKNDLHVYGINNFIENMNILENHFECEYTTMQEAYHWWKLRNSSPK